MIKWSIQRTPQNYLEVNQILSEIYHKQYTGGSKRWEDQKQFMHYPPIKRRVVLHYPHYPPIKRRVVLHYPHYQHKQITLEELRNMKNQKDYSKNWYVVVTEENKKVLKKWYSKHMMNDFPIGGFVGMFCRDGKSYESGWDSRVSPNLIKGSWYDFGEEITFDEFRFHILQEYTRQDWLDGRIVIKKPLVTDVLLNSFMKECNKLNGNIQGNSKHFENYLVVSKTTPGLWNSASETNLPIIEDIKQIYKNEVMNEKKVIGYNVKPDFRSAIASITGMVLGNSSSYCDFVNSDTSKTYRELLKLQVLDIWCEPVYEKPKPELPTLYGYEGVDMGDFLKFGCAELSKSWFTSSNSRTIIEMKLDSGKTLTSSHIADIRKYLENV